MEETKIHQLILAVVTVSLLVSVLHYLGLGYQVSYNISGANSLRPGRGGGGVPVYSNTPTPSPTATNATIKMTADVTAGPVPLTVTFTVAMTNAGCGLSVDFGDNHGAAEPCVTSPFGTPGPTPIPNRNFVVTHIYQTAGSYRAYAVLSTLTSTVDISVTQ